MASHTNFIITFSVIKRIKKILYEIAEFSKMYDNILLYDIYHLSLISFLHFINYSMGHNLLKRLK